MVLEATVVCLDNSEWMRNGDYLPNTRLEAQQDAVNLICAAKTQSNPESTVAVMTMSESKSGIHSEVLVTLTQDLGKILSSLHGVKLGGSIGFTSALQVAQLVLKHRQNKNQHQRIVVFVGSPISESSEDLVKLGKKLKKYNVAVDVVNFGEEAENVEKLEAFINAANTNNESHLLNVPSGPHILSDIILSSPVVVGEGGGGGFGAAAAASAAAAAAAAGGDGGDFFGVDANLDPELAMALRISMEEERARQEAAKKATEGSGATAGATTESTPSAASKDVDMASADDDDLQQALALSMGGTAASGSAGGAAPMDMDEDEQMQLALQMSMAAGGDSKPQQQQQQQQTQATDNQDFLSNVLSSLPGVDPNDERIKSVLQSMQGGDKKEEKKDDKKDDKK